MVSLLVKYKIYVRLKQKLKRILLIGKSMCNASRIVEHCFSFFLPYFPFQRAASRPVNGKCYTSGGLLPSHNTKLRANLVYFVSR